ncbi:MAG TPA: alpha/beta hydrolase [Syntrophorhabdales bacterium]|nr:alpha/beta hydrolase [Syntrophorhabdales bacterium]
MKIVGVVTLVMGLFLCLGFAGVRAQQGTSDVKVMTAGSNQAAAEPVSKGHGEPVTRRWVEQRWVLDNVIRSVGMDWDQPRSAYIAAPCGAEASLDMVGIRQRVQKYADASPAFEAAARRREARAKAAEEAGEHVTARENYCIATMFWGGAQWPIDENNEKNKFYNQRKRDCYNRYAKLADHRVEEVWIPLEGGKSLPGWFHLPPGYQGGRIPVVISIPGMDSFKELSVAMYGDRWLNRGIAVLAIDGPGQYESAVLDIYFSMRAWAATGTAAVEWLIKRQEVDPARIGISGNSFGTFFATIAAANEPRIRAVATLYTCFEPGFHSIFEEASPTFKMRFMYMSGFTNENEFDQFRKSMTWEGQAEKIRVPFLCVAGEADELSPMQYTEKLMKTIQSPKRLVVYQDSRHTVAGVPSVSLGPNPTTLVADWMLATLNGKTFPSERWYVDATGRVTKTGY